MYGIADYREMRVKCVLCRHWFSLNTATVVPRSGSAALSYSTGTLLRAVVRSLKLDRWAYHGAVLEHKRAGAPHIPSLYVC